MEEKDKGIWMTSSEAARLLECSKMHVNRLAAKGVLIRRQTSMHRRYLRSSVEKLAESQQISQAT